MKQGWHGLFSVLLICPAVFSSSAVAVHPFSSGFLYVGGSGPGNYSSIQAAINAASPSDVVYIFNDSSPYFEHFVINKSIQLVGEDRVSTVIDGNYSASQCVIFCNASNVSIAHLTVQHSGNGEYDCGVGCAGWNENGIVGIHLSDVIIQDNMIGVKWQDVRLSEISGTLIRNCSYGIWMACSDWHVAASGNKVHENIVTGNSVNGIRVRDFANPAGPCLGGEFYNNEITLNGCCNNSLGIEAGIALVSTHDNSVHDNVIEGNIQGVLVYGEAYGSCHNNQVFHNNIINNSKGLDIIQGQIASTMDNQVFQNNFIGNQEQAYNCQRNVWYRNYWKGLVGVPCFFPRAIPGYWEFDIGFTIPWLVFDWTPALRPYDIPVPGMTD